MSDETSYTPPKSALPILAMVNAVYAVMKRHPMMVFRAGLLPFLLLFVIGLWSTPPEWGENGYQAMRLVEWALMLGLWTFFTGQLMRFVVKGPVEGAPSFLPKLNARELRYAGASVFVMAPVTAFAFFYKQPLFFHMPDLTVMGAMTAFDGKGELLYASLFLGWLMQVFAYVLPAISGDDPRKLGQLMAASFGAMRQDFTRLFAASLLVALPVWLFFAMVRLVLHMPYFTQMAMADEASALAWNLIFFALESLKVFLGGGMLALLWAMAYGRMKGQDHDLG